MAYDGLVNYVISKELNSCLIGGKIDKIFQPNSNEILLGVYCNGIKYALNIVVSPNYYRICVTNNPKANPSFAPNFCMLLRKHLLNTRIVNINTFGFERIIEIEFEGHSKSDDFGNKKMIIELMGKHSNIILVNSENIIIDSIKRFSTNENSYRNILPGFKYVFPISNKLDFTSISSDEEFYNNTLEYIQNNLNMSSSDNTLKLTEIIANTFTGISKISISCIINQLNLADVFCKESMMKIYNYLYTLSKNPSYVIVHPISNTDFSISLLTTDKGNPLQVNAFIDEYYSKKETSETFVTYRNNLSKLILNHMKKLNTKLSNITRKLEECKNTNLYKLYGELITNNLYRIPKEHLNDLTIENYYDNNKLITIPLNKNYTPAINAKNYFKKYNKLKNAKEIVEKQKKDVQDEINYLESIIYEIQLASNIFDIDNIYNEFTENYLESPSLNNSKKLKKNSKQHKVTKRTSHSNNKIGEPIKYKIDEFNVLVGKNNIQNDYITKHAKSEDIWFHAKDVHGSHVILETNNATPSQETINKCASLAAIHSKAYQSSNVPIDYTYIKHVKKASKSRPGMVIYTNYKTVIVKPQFQK